MNSTKIFRSIIFVLLLTTTWSSLWTQTTRNWTGAVSTDWHNPGNWDSDIPQPGDDVIIDVLNTGVFIDAPVEIRSLRVIKGFVSLTAMMFIDQGGSTANGGDGLRINGIPAEASFTVSKDASLTIIGADDDGIQCSGQFINRGTLKIEDSKYGIFGSNSQSSFTNEGYISVETNQFFAVGFSNGNFNNERCGILMVNNTCSITVNSGSIISTFSGVSSSNRIDVNNPGGVVHAIGPTFFDIPTDNGIFDNNPRAIYWTGCKDEFWSSDMSWSRGFDPRAGDSVIIKPNSILPPQLASTTNSILYLRNEDVFTIQALGRLNIDGSAATSQTVGLESINQVTNNGIIEISNTSSDGISSAAEFTNNNLIIINDAKFAAIQTTSINGTFTNVSDASIIIRSPASNGIQSTFGGAFINQGTIAINSSINGIFLWENDDDNTRFDNYGILSIGASSNGIMVLDGTGLPEPTFHNHQCARILTNGAFNFNFESEYMNEGLIEYYAEPSIIAAVTNYVDNGFQYDPFENLLDDNSKILSAPISINDFTNPDSNSGVPFCEGSSTCIIQRSETGYSSATYDAQDIINGEGTIQANMSVILNTPTTNLFGEFTVEAVGTLEVHTDGCTNPD